jgi:hypothetical protein
MSFRFAILDPRSIPAAQAANDAVFAAGPVVGVEVTIPALAACCVRNIDPQHSGGDSSRAAIEDAMTTDLPSEGTTLVTVRADNDALGSMAVLAMRASGVAFDDEMLARIARIAKGDKADRGPWAPKALPTAETPWAPEAREYAALAACVSDFKAPITDRVGAIRHWLETGEVPTAYMAGVDRDRAESARALTAGEIKISVAADGRVAVVESAHRAAMGLGYCLAPLVVARNPSFRVGAGEPHVKFTCAQTAPGYANIKAAGIELAGLEAGWGGSPTIVGSPQGVSSQLALETVVDVVVRHLKTCHCEGGQPSPCMPAGEKSPVCAWCHASLA